MQAVIYTRVSLDRNNARSVEDQERECRAECERRGWPVRAVYCDNGISASRYGKTRPEWEKCKKALRPDDVLVMWEASRAQRDMKEFVTLRDICAGLGVLVSYSGRVLDLSKGDDRFTGGLDALLAERESEQFKERVLRGKRAGALAGRPAGRIKWGYRVAAPGVWEFDPVEAPKVREAVARIIRGDSRYSVWQWLSTQHGYNPPTLTVMTRALESPTLAGLRVHRGQVVGKGSWPAIITEKQHRQLLARKRRSPSVLPGPEPQHLLSGIATCGKCGEGVGWRKNQHKNGIYACRRGHATRIAKHMDKHIEDKLFDRLAEVDPHQFEGDDPAGESLWAQIEELEGKRAVWQKLALAGKVTPESFALFEQDLSQQIAALEAQAVPPQYTKQDLAGVRANWGDMTMRDKRRIIRGFFTIVIEPATAGRRVGLEGVVVTPI